SVNVTSVNSFIGCILLKIDLPINGEYTLLFINQNLHREFYATKHVIALDKFSIIGYDLKKSGGKT
ncbi:MAG: hypothetical protein M0Z70_14360, partial [Nitrospiraceae bacterium]|nr:hypothetical protein [Nitrospiraceae bacterium]